MQPDSSDIDSQDVVHRSQLYVFLRVANDAIRVLTCPGSDADPASWSMAEMGIGIFGACLPTLRPLLRKVSGTRDTKPTSYGRISKGSNDTEKNLSQSTQTEPQKAPTSDLGASQVSTNNSYTGTYSFEQTPRADV